MVFRFHDILSHGGNMVEVGVNIFSGDYLLFSFLDRNLSKNPGTAPSGNKIKHYQDTPHM
jgi:hypothetical protein